MERQPKITVHFMLQSPEDLFQRLISISPPLLCSSRVCVCVCVCACVVVLVQLIAPGLITAAKEKHIDFSTWYARFINTTWIVCSSLILYLILKWIDDPSNIFACAHTHPSLRRHVFFVDERFVPLKHEDNNFRCAMFACRCSQANQLN